MQPSLLELLDGIAGGDLAVDDKAAGDLRDLRERVILADKMIDAGRNLYIAISMGWDTDGVMAVMNDAVRAYYPPPAPATPPTPDGVRMVRQAYD